MGSNNLTVRLTASARIITAKAPVLLEMTNGKNTVGQQIGVSNSPVSNSRSSIAHTRQCHLSPHYPPSFLFILPPYACNLSQTSLPYPRSFPHSPTLEWGTPTCSEARLAPIARSSIQTPRLNRPDTKHFEESVAGTCWVDDARVLRIAYRSVVKW